MEITDSIQLFAALVTAFATVVLCIFTWVLSRETKRLAAATAQPSVTATIEPNISSTNHFELILENSGNAAAFDVRVQTDPKIGPEQRSTRGGGGVYEVDVLRPNRKIRSYVADADKIKDINYSLSISWKRAPNHKRRESISYSYDVSKFKGLASLGSSTPLHELAHQIKKAREDWLPVATGQNKLTVKIDAINSHTAVKTVNRGRVDHD